MFIKNFQKVEFEQVEMIINRSNQTTFRIFIIYLIEETILIKMPYKYLNIKNLHHKIKYFYEKTLR